MAALASHKGLRALSLPAPSPEEAVISLPEKTDPVLRSSSVFHELQERLYTYFAGQWVSFEVPLDMAGATPFQEAIWEATLRIPFGEARTYQQIAETIGKPGAARAAGQALGANPIPIVIPCHRVVANGGRIGGYRGGLDLKRRLLELEGCVLKGTLAIP